MNIVKLERMIAVYEAGSFRKAARGFGMSQPALTWSIRQLEESLGLSLFERGPSGIRPTEVCETLIVRARLIVNEHNRLLAEVERTNRSQVIVVGVHPVLLNSQFAHTVATFRAQEPTVTLRVVEAYSADLIALLRRGELDLAFSAAPEGEEEEVAFEPLLRQYYSVFGRADHKIFGEIAGGGEITQHAWAQADAPNVAAGRAAGAMQHDNANLVLELLARFGMTESTVAVRSASMHLIRRMVLDGGLLGMIPESQFATELHDGTVRQVPGSNIEGPPLGLLWIDGGYETVARRRLKSALRIMQAPERLEIIPVPDIAA
ncbi:LysR family transcriptional regulator [Novosphingobium barchaimii LL02]|uniref:LysR family transcriptional regulator n=1 Tax=Novosphingobium barchaimii LL02 TaxID=1114963 RepID=A0A0J7XY13_9SPHN|nr:LysR family transcriptional regulator [Novosphingobium barchaimii]KMS56551.1 LysR family transcriptional regulator [Novosphingobium barchaimii LL02]